MNNFGEFLYKLRKEKGMTQAELAETLGVTNKAVSKWETGEAMPETALLLPISRIFGVSVDELLEGKRSCQEKDCGDEEFDVNKHLFTRGKNGSDEKTLLDIISGAVCCTVFMLGLITYLCLGAIFSMWHPYWVIVSVCALSCGIIGIIFDICNKKKCERKKAKGENPYTGAACGIIMLSCIIAYILTGALTGLWHPTWLIVVCGGVVCGITGAVGEISVYKNKK